MKKIKKCFEALRNSKKYRHNYYYTWKPKFRSYYIEELVLIPTICVTALPWCRVDDYLIRFHWLNMSLYLGKVNYKEKKAV